MLGRRLSWHTPAAPWRRCLQTGYYAMVLDTQTLRIPHFGPVPGGVSYAAAARADNGVWQNLPPAELALNITAGGKTYRCTAGGAWTEFTGPRLIESGRFLQRADVTDLVFTAEDGARLNVEARFETVAWPDRLGLILAARPGLAAHPRRRGVLRARRRRVWPGWHEPPGDPAQPRTGPGAVHAGVVGLCSHRLPGVRTDVSVAGVQEPARGGRGQLRHRDSGRPAAGPAEYRRRSRQHVLRRRPSPGR